jgi:hypothetical protein
MSEPSGNAGDGDHGAAVAHGLVVTGREAPVSLELRKQVLGGFALSQGDHQSGSNLRVLCLIFREDGIGPDHFDWMSPAILIGRFLIKGR